MIERGSLMFKLDHVVYFTEKVPEEVVEEQRNLGWHAVLGGSHENWGTHNALMYVKNAYIEWLSVENEEVANKSNHQLVELLLRDIEGGEDWGTICFSVDEITAFDERIRKAGYRTSGVLNAERKTIDGSIRRWKMLFVDQTPSNELPLPFFIEWEKDDDTRLNELRENGTILPDNEKLEITECLFYVNDPVNKATEWANLLSAEMSRENTIKLRNVKLQFMKKEMGSSKERLSEVVIEHLSLDHNQL